MENVKKYLYDIKTGEYQGTAGISASKEQGLTTIPPLEPKDGHWVKWNGKEWVYEVDNRGKEVYSKTTGDFKGVWDSLNPLREDLTTIKPPQFGVWTGDEWEVSAVAENKWQMKQTIEANKKRLADEDYKVIKSLEQLHRGVTPDYDVDTLFTQRQALRDEINELEKALDGNKTSL